MKLICLWLQSTIFFSLVFPSTFVNFYWFLSNYNGYILCVDQQGPVEGPQLSCVPRSTRSLSTALVNYNRLILGKLERFMINLEDRCTPLWQKSNISQCSFTLKWGMSSTPVEPWVNKRRLEVHQSKNNKSSRNTPSLACYQGELQVWNEGRINACVM